MKMNTRNEMNRHNTEKNMNQNFFAKYGSTLALLITTISSAIGIFIYLNSQFTLVHKENSDMQKEIAIVKTVLIMKDIMPRELAKTEKITEKKK
jgi:hypothetical protein